MSDSRNKKNEERHYRKRISALEEELLADEKERAEHVMLVDLARNDCGKISAVRFSKSITVYECTEIFTRYAYRFTCRG